MRVGIVGTGFGARIQAPGFVAAPSVELTGFCSAQRERAEAAAARFDVQYATDDYFELIGRDDVDLVSVCVPPHLHCDITLAALDAGKHVLCEKPLALDTAQAIEMADRAATSPTINAVTHQRRYLASRRQFFDTLREDWLGELRLVRTSYHTDYAVDPNMEPYWFTWVSEREKGGGMVRSMLSHHLDLLRWFFADDITNVYGRPDCLLPERPTLAWDFRDGDPIGPDTEPAGRRAVDVDDTITVLGTIAGAPLTTTASWAVHHAPPERFEAYGSEGTVVLDGTAVFAGRRTDSGLTEIRTGSPDPTRFTSDNEFACLAEDLARAVDHGAADTSFATFADGLAVQRVIDVVLNNL